MIREEYNQLSFDSQGKETVNITLERFQFLERLIDRMDDTNKRVDEFVEKLKDLGIAYECNTETGETKITLPKQKEPEKKPIKITDIKPFCEEHLNSTEKEALEAIKEKEVKSFETTPIEKEVSEPTLKKETPEETENKEEALIKEAEGTIEPIIKESKDFPINVAEDPIKSNSVELLYKCLELGFNPKVVPGKNTEKKMNTMLNMFYRGPEHLEEWVTTEHNSSYLKHLWLNKKEVAPGPIVETIVEEVKENNFEIDLDGCEFGFKMTSRDLEAASFIQGQLEDICGVTKDNFAKLYDKCGMEDVFLGLEEFCVGATIEQIQAFVKSL